MRALLVTLLCSAGVAGVYGGTLGAVALCEASRACEQTEAAYVPLDLAGTVIGVLVAISPFLLLPPARRVLGVGGTPRRTAAELTGAVLALGVHASAVTLLVVGASHLVPEEVSWALALTLTLAPLLLLPWVAGRREERRAERERSRRAAPTPQAPELPQGRGGARPGGRRRRRGRRRR